MTCCQPIDVCVLEDTPAVLFGRIRDQNGALITKAGTSSISYKVIDTDTGTVNGSGTFVVNDCVFDTLQLDEERWKSDKKGFNFRATVPAACIPDGDAVLMCEVKFTPVTGDITYGRWRMTVDKLYGS